MKNLILLLITSLPLIVNGQGHTSDEALNNIFDYYNKAVGKGAAIFNGPEYTGGDPTVKGHQFYPARSYTYGSVVYRGYQYDSLVLNYDAVTDQLVVVFSEDGGFAAITPEAELVSAFMLPENLFINMPEKDGLSAGYYEVLYDGPTRVLSKRRKESVQANEKDYLYRYDESHRYYVYHKGTYHQVRSKGAVLALFQERKSELKAFTRSNRLLYKDAPARYITKVAEYIDSE